MFLDIYSKVGKGFETGIDVCLQVLPLGKVDDQKSSERRESIWRPPKGILNVLDVPERSRIHSRPPAFLPSSSKILIPDNGLPKCTLAFVLDEL